MDHGYDTAFFVSLIIPGLTLIAIPWIFSANIHSVREYFRSRRVWDWFMVQRSGSIVLCLLGLAVCYGAAMQLFADVVELRRVNRGELDYWNRNWAVEDTWRVPTLR